MPRRTTPATAARTRAPRNKPAPRSKPNPERAKPPPRARADDVIPVVLKEDNSDGVTAKELQRRIALQAAVSPAFIEALKRDFARHGAVAIAKTRELAPATYVRLAAVLLPKDAPPADPAPEPLAPACTPAPAMDEAAARRRMAELHALLARPRDRESRAGEEAAAPQEGGR